MRMAGSILTLMLGAALGITLFFSCGDNLRVSADAAIDAPKMTDAIPNCDCPATEPPLAGRFVMFSNRRDIPPNDFMIEDSYCPPGSKLITGSCTQSLPAPYSRLTLEQSGFFEDDSNDWVCWFRNHENTTVTIRTSVICLIPAP